MRQNTLPGADKENVHEKKSNGPKVRKLSHKRFAELNHDTGCCRCLAHHVIVL